jgi:benzodiazapine receptor
MSRRRGDVAALVASLAAAYGAAGIGTAATIPAVKGWYRTLDRPSWRPPDSVFGPVWSVLYSQMAVGAWLVWRSDRSATSPPLLTYGAQLVLNVAWTLLFFRLKRPGLALLEIVVLWLAIVRTIDEFRRRSRAAALLLVPYLAWTTFAAALTYSIWRRNR